MSLKRRAQSLETTNGGVRQSPLILTCGKWHEEGKPRFKHNCRNIPNRSFATLRCLGHGNPANPL
jgi:hypothetical protein